MSSAFSAIPGRSQKTPRMTERERERERGREREGERRSLVPATRKLLRERLSLFSSFLCVLSWKFIRQHETQFIKRKSFQLTFGARKGLRSEIETREKASERERERERERKREDERKERERERERERETSQVT